MCIRDSGLGLQKNDSILMVVPMFHVMGWGLPYLAPMNGIKLVLPGMGMDGAALTELIEKESVTLAFGVPTIWLGLLNYCKENNIKLYDIDIICVTRGPGLIGGLISGINFAKGLAFSTGKPLIGVNHLVGHALTPQMTDDLSYPYLLLLASGGHCQYLAVLQANEIKRLGTTIDDAPGEVFDKVAKMLSLPIFSGSEVEKWAEKGDKNRFSFPLPLINKNDCDLSFSGLKSSVRRQVDYLVEKQSGLYLRDQRDICASFQKSMKLIFEQKTKNAIELFSKVSSVKSLAFSLAGGVAANKEIRNSLRELCDDLDVRFSAPPLDLCTDNGLMIAYAGTQMYLGGQVDDMDLSPRPRWPIDLDNQHSLGFGKRGRKV